MSVVVTGASGHLGRLTVQALLDRGVEPGRVVAAARTPERLDDLAGRGVDVRRADYTDPTSLKGALAGAESVLLISGSEFGTRVDQHRAVVEAARDAKVDLIAYTSIVRADSTRMLLAADHAATEGLIVESGLPYVFLRNSWYLENYTEQIATALEHRVVPGSAGTGRVSAATRADYAAAAAAVLVGDGPRRHVYELGGDSAFTLSDYAATLSDLAGTPVAYADQPAAEYEAFLGAVGVPAPVAHVLADSDLGIARGDLLVESGDLRGLIGRPTTTMAEAIIAELAGVPSGA